MLTFKNAPSALFYNIFQLKYIVKKCGRSIFKSKYTVFYQIYNTIESCWKWM